jgi:Na+/H+ antiporter NhaD/arsenite permease-like protein
MSAAELSLIALLLVIVVSLTSRINIGVLAIALAAAVAILAAGWTPNQVMAEFPSALFLTLVGVTLLFGVAQKNGTLEAITHRVVRLCGGRTALLPLSFFLLAGVLSAVGPGAIAATALVIPLAMVAGVRAGIPVFLIALMVANGANAGNLSPVSAVGIIVLTQMDMTGLAGHEANVFLANFIAHTAVALAAYVLFGGLQLVRAGRAELPQTKPEAFTPTHWFTIAILTVWIVGVVFFRVNPGVTAFVAATILIIGRATDNSSAISSVPWGVILMVSGVSVLIGVMDEIGGLDRFTELLAGIATPGSVNGVMAFVTGIISTYSSTSGVVYPAFLPSVPGLVEQLGGGDALEISLSINVGAALVDVSPLSTIGALCVAALPQGAEDPAVLFRKMLIWGFSMSVAGALFCQLFIGFFTW